MKCVGQGILAIQIMPFSITMFWVTDHKKRRWLGFFRYRWEIQRHGSALTAAGVIGCASMTMPLYKRDGLDFRLQDGKKSDRQFVIIAFVIGCAASDLYTNNHPVKKHAMTELRHKSGKKWRRIT